MGIFDKLFRKEKRFEESEVDSKMRKDLQRHSVKTSSGFVFEIDTPSSWSVNIDQYGQVIGTPPNFTSFLDPETGNKIAIPNIGVQIVEEEWVELGELSKLVDDFIAFKPKTHTDFRLIKRSNFNTSSAEKGELIFFEYRIGDHLLKTVQAIAIKQRWWCTIVGEAEAKEFSRWEHHFLQIIQSLQLIPPKYRT